MFESFDIVTGAYAATIGVGGITTFIKSGCPVALTLGVLSGGLATYSATQPSNDPKNTKLIQAVSLIHGSLYLQRYYKTRVVWPAGVFALLSSCILIRSTYRSFKDSDEQLKKE